MASNTVSAISTAVATVAGRVIIGTTPPSIYERLIRQDALIIDPSDELVQEYRLCATGDGQVTIVKSKATGKRFARKVTPPRKLETPNEIHVFEVSRLRDHPHPRILSFTSLRDTDHPGGYVLWSSFCAGGDLAEQLNFWRIRRRTEIPHRFLLHIVVQTFEALAFLHYGLRYASNGKYYQDADHKAIVHGDMKEDNIFLRWGPDNIGGMPDLVIGDFGRALVEGRRGAKVLIGTKIYDAPEIKAIYGSAPNDAEHRYLFYQAGGAKTPAADIYAVAVMLYMTVAKDNRPFPVDRDLSELTISRDYEIPGLQDFIVKCLQIDPSRRATADFDEHTGVMHTVEKFRDLRDSMLQKAEALGPTDWARPQPVR
ncbi:hypothetical protein AC578_3438 [Pseudocercospora eumusae]|uniref:non-specific serine/threonine protein kinase n=1 Tax=Pseudocercospora eumusae TaxID=321146 RepID=A0A139HR88_9PEZI|nr:hypothetical protein AC578_3438 [Pseudocercospora eumusae]